MPSNKLKAQNSKRKTIVQSSKIQKKDTIIEPKVKSTKKLTIEVFDTKGKAVSTIELPKEIFGANVNKALLAQAVRIYLSNQRRGTVSVKTRGEVTGSTRKIYRQKGTGRARHGGIRAPIFVHGGVAHGPKPRDYSLAFPKKMKKRALFSALSATYQNNGVRVIGGLEKLPPKTKAFANVLEKLLLVEPKKKTKKNILLVGTKGLENVDKAARNIAGLTLTQATQLNAYSILQHDILLFSKEAVKTLTEFSFRKEKENV